MPTTAPMKACSGCRKNTAPKKAKANPTRDPSRFLPLLKEMQVFPSNLPKIDAALSPNETIAIDA